MTSLPLAHVAGLPVEETLGSFTPALLLAFGAASATLRARLRRARSRSRARRATAVNQRAGPVMAPMKPGVGVVALAAALCALLGSAALAAPGDFDPGFGQNGRLTLDSDIARALALQPDGRILVAGEVATNTPSVSDGVVHRLNASGSLDRTFGSGGAVRLGGIFSGGYALALQPDGKVLTVGFASSANAPSGEDALVFRRDPGGLSDQAFGQGGSVVLDSGGNERPYALALQPGDGKILVAGETYDRNTAKSKLVVYRLTAGGKLDDGFGQSGTSHPDAGGSGAIYKLALQPDGGILAAGYTEANDNRNAVVYRLNADGTPDSGFGQGGKAEFDEGGSEGALAVAPQPDGHIVLAANAGDALGTTADAIVYRLRADGTADPTFGAGGNTRIADSDTNVAYALALQTDGKIVLAGGAAVNGATDAAVYRLNPDGSPDAGFDGDGTLHIESDGGEAAVALAISPDGRIVIAGVAISGLSQRAVLYRLQGGDPVSLPPASTASPTAVTSRPRAPALGRLRITPEAFRAAPKGASALAAARSGGALVSFTLDRAASMRFTVERAGRGRHVGGRCAKPSRSNHRGRRCTRYTTLAGGFTRHGVAGANRFHFTGRLNARRLRSGSYRLIATPSADGRRGEAQRARFHIKD